MHLENIGSGIVAYDSRVRRVLPKIAWRWKYGYKGFSSIHPPEKVHSFHWMDRLVTDHEQERHKAIFRFIQGNSQRSGKPAVDILRRLKGQYRTHKEYFDPRLRLEQSDQFATIIKKFDAQTDEKVGKLEPIGWYRQMWQSLAENYDGDPRQLFYHPNDGNPDSLYDQLMAADINCYMQIAPIRERIIQYLCRYPGIQRKIASMIITFFQQDVWSDRPEFWERFQYVPVVPADIHHLRFFRGLDFVHTYTSDYRDKIAHTVSDYLSRICFEERISHIDVAQGIFNTGSVFHNRYNSLKNEHDKQAHCIRNCPFNDLCVYVVPVDADTNSNKRHKRNTRRKQRLSKSQFALDLCDDDGVLFALTDEDYEDIYNRPETRNRGSINWGKAYLRPHPIYEHLLVVD